MQNRLFPLPPGARHLLSRFRDAGFDAHVVGGCVRDSLVGFLPNDWDICTNAVPNEVMKIFSDKKIIKTGLKHGTVTIVMPDRNYEVTTYRIDGDYSDNRHPDSVTFTDDLTADLSRRDFTINAMAYNEFTGLADPFGGYADLENEIIRCVGNPDDRFNEDALRILRALRFSSTYGLKIDESTAASIHRNKDLLNNISAERIQSELCKMLKGENILNILLEFSDVITTIIPELKPCVGFNQNNKYHQYTVYDHIAHAVANYQGGSISIKIALLLHDIGKPFCYTEDENGGHFHGHAVPSRDLAEQVLTRLKFDNRTKTEVLDLVLYHDATIEPTYKSARRWLSKIGEDRFYQWGLVRAADMSAHTCGTQDSRFEKLKEIGRILDQVLADESCFKIKDLAINGDDVMALGIPQGKRVGEILQHLLNRVMDEEIPNERLALIAEVKRLIESEVK